MKTVITIPDNLNELTVAQYQKYLLNIEGTEGEFTDQRTIEVLCNIPLKNVFLMTHKDVKSIAEGLRELLNSEVQFKHRFKIQSQEFGFIPDLENITSGEYADLCAYINKPEEMHKLMAILFRPVTHRVKDKYDIYPYTGTVEFSDVMKFTPLGIAFGAMVFFWNLTVELANATQSYLRQELEKEGMQESLISGKNGDSIKTFTPLQKEMLQNLMK